MSGIHGKDKKWKDPPARTSSRGKPRRKWRHWKNPPRAPRSQQTGGKTKRSLPSASTTGHTQKTKPHRDSGRDQAALHTSRNTRSPASRTDRSDRKRVV